MELQPTLDILCRACHRAAESWSLEEGCSAAVRAAREALGCRTAALLLLADGDLSLRVVVHRGLSDHFAYHFRPNLTDRPTLDRVVRGGEAVLLDDAAADPEAARDLRLEQDAASVLATPVRAGSVGLGCLVCDAAEPHAFDPNAVTLCCLLAYVVGSVHTRSMLREQQRHLQLTDPETGVYAFEFFCRRLREEMTRADRTGRGLGVALVEIDHLDRYERMYGRREALAAHADVVRLLTQRLRPVDTVGRYHLWQLAACLPETDASGAAAAAERLRAAVAGHAFPHAEPRLSLSAGVADYRPHDTVQALMQRVTRALYRAQLEGGDRIVTAEPAAGEA